MFQGSRQVLHKHGDQKKEKPDLTEPALLPILSATALLETERRQQLLKILPSLSMLPAKEYQALYVKLVHLFAEFAQQLPETKSGYYPYAGGLLDHGLERAVRALAISRSFIPVEGDTKENLLKQAMLRYVIFSAALLYDVGRLATKVSVMICNKEGVAIKRWHPYEGAMVGQGTHYKYIFEKENWDFLRTMVTPLLARQLMMGATLKELMAQKDKLITTQEGFAWIAQDREILETWFAMFKEDIRQPNALLTIIPLADAQALANYFNLEQPLEALGQPEEGFWEKYGNAIASYAEEITKQSQAMQRFLDKKQSDNFFLRGGVDQIEASKEAERNKETPLTELAPENMVGDVAARKQATVPATAAAGLAFFRWLLKQMDSGALTVNQSDSMVHRVGEGVFLTSDLFRQFSDIHTQYKDPEMIRKQFSGLGFTLAGADNEYMFSYRNERPGEAGMKQGMLLRNPYLVFQKRNALPEVNRTLQLVGGVVAPLVAAHLLGATTTTVAPTQANVRPKTGL